MKKIEKYQDCLITNIVNEAKDQLVQISAMNASIQSDNAYELETRGIGNAIGTIGKLYNALSFDYLKDITMNELKELTELMIKEQSLIKSAIDADKKKSDKLIN